MNKLLTGAALKAVVFKTARLKETRDFFEKELGMKINECSGTHFVIHERQARILFVQSDGGPESELYLKNHCSKHLTVYEDPNQIKIVIC